MSMKICSRVVKYGEDVNTDVIIPSKYLAFTSPHDLAKHAMEGLDQSFPEKVQDRKIVVAAKNFGCGSSREQAPVALKYAGIEAVVADSFARIFYRNAVNIGLPVLECPGVAEAVADGDEVEVDMSEGLVRDLSNGRVLHGNKTPGFLLRIMEKGLVQYIKEGRS
jgi:3-isopropylmalate/(R)-2-methylmalate dehydratase small subunit